MAVLQEALIGCLLGTALGDAVGLPAEGLSRRRQARLMPRIDGPGLLFGRGLVSDDTEHTAMVVRALAESAGAPSLFARSLARQLRVWTAQVPVGVGLATLRAGIKLWVGFGPERSGVWSAGNGPAMRSAPIGVCVGGDTERCRALVRVSSRLTHTDPKAEYGAYAVALAAYAATFGAPSPALFLSALHETLGAEAAQLLACIERAVASCDRGETTEVFAESMGLSRGVSGYVLHTVPVALHAWFRHPLDLREAVMAVVRCGGDTDTTGAIVGGIVGAACGKQGLPSDWLARLVDWPRTPAWMEQISVAAAGAVSSGNPRRTSAPAAPFVLARNLIFLTVVLGHGFRRMLPPY